MVRSVRVRGGEECEGEGVCVHIQYMKLSRGAVQALGNGK